MKGSQRNFSFVLIETNLNRLVSLIWEVDDNEQDKRFSGGGGSELVAAGDPARETAGALLSVISCSTRSEAGDIHAGDAELQGCEKFCQKLGENEMIEHYLGIILGWHWMASTFPIQVPVVHDALCLSDQVSGIYTVMLIHVLCRALFQQWNVVGFELCNVNCHDSELGTLCTT